MTTQTQNVFAETRTFYIRGYYKNKDNGELELERRKYSSQNRFETIDRAKKDGLVKFLTAVEITDKKIKLSGRVIYGN